MHYSNKKRKEIVALAVCVYPERYDVSNWSDNYREKFTWMMVVIGECWAFITVLYLKKKSFKTGEIVQIASICPLIDAARL